MLLIKFQLIATHEGYKNMVGEIWNDSKSFREQKMILVREMHKEWSRFLDKMEARKAEELKVDIIEHLEDADFIPRTVVN